MLVCWLRLSGFAWSSKRCWTRRRSGFVVSLVLRLCLVVSDGFCDHPWIAPIQRRCKSITQIEAYFFFNWSSCLNRYYWERKVLALLWKVLPWQLTLCFLILHGLSLRQQLVLVIGCVSIELKKHHYKSLCSHGDSLFSSSQPLDFKMLVIFSSKNIKRGHKLKLTYLYACWIMQVRYHWQISKWNVKDGKKSLGKVWNSVCCLEKKLLSGTHFVESYCTEPNISDINWLRYRSSSYLIKIWLSRWRHQLAKLHG